MDQQSSTNTTSDAETDLRFIPAPLASGSSVTDADGQERRVMAITVQITLAETPEPVAVELDYRCGARWAGQTLIA